MTNNMTDKKDLLTTKVLLREVIEKNKSTLDVIDFYLKIADIIERTDIARGKRTMFKISTSSTINEKINTNVFASTH